MSDLIKAIASTPLPLIFILAGLIFFFIATVGSFRTDFKVGSWGRIFSGALGGILLVVGLFFQLSPTQSGSGQTTVTPTSVAVQPPLTNTPFVPTVTPIPSSTLNPTNTPTLTPTNTRPPTPTVKLITVIPTEEYIDTETQEQGMHACPKGYAIGGVHVDTNRFLCRRVMLKGEEIFVSTILDTATQRQNMHACPQGTYMRGLHADQNLLLCSYDSRRGPNDWKQEFLDSGTQGYDMHICPRPISGVSYLTGIHVAKNLFLCANHSP